MHLTLSLQYPYSQVYFTELNGCKRSHKFAVNKNNCALHVLSERGPCSLLNVKWWWRDVSARRKKKKRRGEEACFRVIMNMNTGSTMQLSPNYWLCPEGWEDRTRPTSTAVLSLLLGSDSPHMRVVQQRTIWQLHPSAWHKIKGVVGRKGRERGGRSI